MYNPHNEAIVYLKRKLGTRVLRSGLNTKKSPNRIDTIYIVSNIIPYSDEHMVHLLLTQQYYGLEARKELYNKLVELGEIKEEKDLVV